MAHIIQLSPHVANLIAAGEVVERPASVVKELLENAVDAGATVVHVEIEEGGLRLIRVSDDGCGMLPEDAETAFLRHATSKIRDAGDLAAIATMGFRGEALAAIASVSQIDILTRPASELEGTSLHLEAGKITERLPAGCPAGTTIFVRNLFYNTPARMKFMKRDSVEASAVQAVVQSQAFAHPEVSFHLLREGKEVLATPGGGDLLPVIYQVLGRQTALEMAPVSGEWEDYRITGFASTPANTRGTRGGQYFFVNNRPVKSRLLMAALEQAYQNQLLPGRYPSCVLHLTLPAAELDVNVHPAKTEIKFLNERGAFDCVHYGVRAALAGATDRPAMRLKQPATPQQQIASAQAAPKGEAFRTMTPEQFRAFASQLDRKTKATPAQAKAVLPSFDTDLPRARVCTPVVRPVRVTVDEPELLDDAAPQNPAAPAKPAPPPVQAAKPAQQSRPTQAAKPAQTTPAEQVAPTPVEEQAALPLPEAPRWRLVGEVLDTYLIVEQEGTVFFIDKHAAHERMLFEQLRAQPGEIQAQALAAPLVAQLTPQEAAVALAEQEQLETLGFSLSDIGDGEVLLRAVPADLDAADAAAALAALCQDLLDGKTLDPDARRDRMLHTVACKAAIKGGWKSDPREIQRIAEQVMTRDDLRYCPHGRPICIQLTKSQLETQFKRS